MLKRLNLPAPGALFAAAASALRGVPALLVCLAAASPEAPGSPQGTPGGEFRTPADVAERLRGMEGEGLATGRSRSAAMELLMGGPDGTGRCATPLLLALDREPGGLGPAGSVVLRRLGPRPGAFETAFPPAAESFSGTFRLVFSTRRGDPSALSPDDGDLDGVPDEARDILDRLAQARRDVLSAFESTRTPASRPESGEGIHQVEISDLPGEVGGYVWSRAGETLLVLDKEMLDSRQGDAILRHQVAHLLQVGLTAEESPWWYEAHAVWAEDPQGIHAGRRAGPVAAYLETSPEGLEPGPIAAWEGAFLWPHFLVLSGGRPAVLGAAWEEMAALPGNNTLQAMRHAVASILGTSLEDQVRAYRIWNLLLGPLDDGNHYPFAAQLEGRLGDMVRVIPDAWEGPGMVAPLGSEALHLTAGSSPGGWLLGFQGSAPAGWDVTLLTVPAYLGARPSLSTLQLDEGRGKAAIPWKEMAGLLVVIQNLGDPLEPPAEFTLDAAYDPLVPFELMSFAATDEGGGAVALRWRTDGEMGMAGWRLYRSRHPLSGFQPVQAVLIPAIGGEEAASYVVIDRGLAQGGKYYYMLEGITRQGFRELSYPVSVRVRPSR